jgi:hypothetical protein
MLGLRGISTIGEEAMKDDRHGAAVLLSKSGDESWAASAGKSTPSMMYLNGHGLSRFKPMEPSVSTVAKSVCPRNGRK